MKETAKSQFLLSKDYSYLFLNFLNSKNYSATTTLYIIRVYVTQELVTYLFTQTKPSFKAELFTV